MRRKKGNQNQNKEERTKGHRSRWCGSSTVVAWWLARWFDEGGGYLLKKKLLLGREEKL